MKKMLETIAKKVGAAVINVNGYEENGKEIMLDVDLADWSSNKVVLRKAKNQYGEYYRFVSCEEYKKEVDLAEVTYVVQPEEKAEEPAIEQPESMVVEKAEIQAEKKAAAKLRTKTERLCGARRKEIIRYAEENIVSLVDGTATLKEIEGPAKEDTAIRFVLILNDGSRVKEDIAVETIRESIA